MYIHSHSKIRDSMKHTTLIAMLIIIATGRICQGSTAKPQSAILVTGGAGYIGSATTLELLQQGYNVVVIDKKLPESSFFASSPQITELDTVDQLSFPRGNGPISSRAIFIQSDFDNPRLLAQLFSRFSIEAVIHFAGFSAVGLSCVYPESFYENNVQKTLTLLRLMLQHGVTTFIFSSSAATYGLPQCNLITESTPTNPINPYGRTKYMIELILADYAKSYNFKAVSLRYFNAAGALPDYDIGELHDPETHVIPLLLRAAYNEQTFTMFGDDYQTPDGSCIRDYLHIHDLATAHCLALKHLEKDTVTYDVFNLGTGKGTSVKELVSAASRVTGLPISVTISPRRQGDPDRLVADATKAQAILGWIPTQSFLDTIIETAHTFARKKKSSIV